MKKLRLENTLSRAAILSLLVFCSCSKSIVNTRQVNDFSGLQSRTIKRQNLLASNNLKIKFKTSVEIDGKENKLSGKIYALSDTCLFLNVMSSSLGIEIGQLRMNKDSVFMINKIDKTYFSGTYADFKSKFDTNFEQFYSFITASYFKRDSIFFNSSNASYIADLQRFIVNDCYSNSQTKSFLTTIFDRYGNVWRVEYKSFDGNLFRANYSNFVLDYGFPSELVLSAKVRGAKYEFTVYFENVSVIKESAFPEMKKSLGKYKQVTF